jgi:hypothetical protein
MKTNARWYMQLPEPYRMQAIGLAEKDDAPGMLVSSLAEASCAFAWTSTPRGFDY